MKGGGTDMFGGMNGKGGGCWLRKGKGGGVDIGKNGGLGKVLGSCDDDATVPEESEFFETRGGTPVRKIIF